MIVLRNDGREAAETCCVSTHNSTPARELSPSGALQIAEDLAGAHLRLHGYPYERLAAEGGVFLLSAQTLCYCPGAARPRTAEELTAVTWQRGTDGVRFVRDTEFLNAAGERALYCISNWFLAHPVTHQICRPRESPLFSLLENPGHALPGKGHITLPRPDDSFLPCGTHTVSFSELDCNGHMNNTRYADLLMDFLPESAQRQPISVLTLVYTAEAHQGDELRVFWRRSAENVFDFYASHDRGRCFSGRIEF